MPVEECLMQQRTDKNNKDAFAGYGDSVQGYDAAIRFERACVFTGA